MPRVKSVQCFVALSHLPGYCQCTVDPGKRASLASIATLQVGNYPRQGTTLSLAATSITNEPYDARQEKAAALLAHTTTSIAEAVNREVQNGIPIIGPLFMEQVQSRTKGLSANHINDDGGCILTLTLACCKSTYPMHSARRRAWIMTSLKSTPLHISYVPVCRPGARIVLFAQ